MSKQAGRQRGALIVTTIGCVLIVLAMIVMALVLIDKPHFQSLVGPMFLEIMTGGIFVGAILLLIGAWRLPDGKRWHRYVLLVWGIVALTSPAFGILFLLPLGVLVLSLPLVGMILVSQFREA